MKPRVLALPWPSPSYREHVGNKAVAERSLCVSFVEVKIVTILKNSRKDYEPDSQGSLPTGGDPAQRPCALTHLMEHCPSCPWDTGLGGSGALVAQLGEHDSWETPLCPLRSWGSL